ncbi:GNAT family N-acetyltransferase [Bacillus carboniphilus]|uniref:GNAT family N-acetyltransferase n=1 Tax=Bacillus carboniphilus TaxID=86663 RepID=A0ABY9JV03_9BACI|nr:GNAT family N-acetyltransferase [Bacillus carboniphilus]WLR42255.1 GNAT family N-acetyltransferase [Bacillus carboniphilus]
MYRNNEIRTRLEGVMMMVIHETDRLNFILFDESHLEAMVTFWGNEEVMKYSNGQTDQEKFPQIIKAYQKCHKEHGLSVYAIEEKATKNIIGAAGFNIEKSLETIELIYHFEQQSWGKGYATEVARACLSMAENNGHVKVVTASADPRNQASLQVLKKIGFQYKGMKWFEDTAQEEPYFEYYL